MKLKVSGFDTLASYLIRVKLVCVGANKAAFPLDQRHLVLSGSDGYPRVWTLWDLLNVDYTGLDLISSVKRLFPLTFVSFSFGEAANRLGRKRK